MISYGNVRNIVTAGMFALVAAPLIFFSPAPWSDPIEKRASAPMPILPKRLQQLPAFLSEFQAYFDDHFGFRESLIALRNEIDFSLLHRSPTPRVLIGKNDWLFYTGERSIEDFRGEQRLSDADLEKWRLTLKQRHDWLAARGIVYLFFFGPNKQSIYPEYMPSNVVRGRTTQLDQLIAYLSSKGESGLLEDLRPGLLSQKTDLPLYHAIDVHWNAYGAYEAYRVLMNTLTRKVAGIHVLELSRKDFDFDNAQFGDAAEMMRLHPYPHMTRTARYVGPKLSCAHIVTPPPVANVEIKPVEEEIASDCDGDGRTARLMMFRTSMTEAMLGYLSDSFMHARFTWTLPSFHDFKLYVEAERPNVVIEERVERAIIYVPTPERERSAN